MEAEILVPSQSLLEKLQVKDEKNMLIQGLPSTVEKQFVKLSFSKSVTPLLKVKKIDFALLFAISQQQLKAILKDVLPSLNPEAKLWIAYPKLTSKIVSDLSRDHNWECISHCGFEGVRMISVDHVWCAIRFKRAEQVKVTVRVPAEMNGIDLSNRTVTAPVDLEKLLAKNKKAGLFFETLSFTNKKEYVLWINSAKREETKMARLEATLEKLNNGKRNPSEK